MRRVAILIICFSFFLNSLILAEVAENSRIYTLPRSEIEDIVNDWLSHAGFTVYVTNAQIGLVRINALKGNENWEIFLRQNSPLATEVQATYTSDNLTDHSQLQTLWNFLSGYHKGSAVDVEASNSAIPTPVLARMESIVCITAAVNEDTVQFSGFIVDESGLILCTAHNLKGLKGISITLFDGATHKGRIVKIDYDRDLALIDVDLAFGSYVSLADGVSLVGMGQKVYSVGCPENLGGTIYSGFINGPPRSVDNHFLWQVSMKVYPGSSGSPVFDPEGNLVAVVKARHRGTDSLGFLIPYETITAFVRDIRQ